MLELVCNWMYVHTNGGMCGHLRRKANCKSDVSHLHTVLYIQDIIHIIFVSSSLLLLSAILIISSPYCLCYVVTVDVKSISFLWVSDQEWLCGAVEGEELQSQATQRRQNSIQ